MGLVYMRIGSLLGQFFTQPPQTPAVDLSDIAAAVREEPPPYVRAALTNELADDDGPEGVGYLAIFRRADG